MARKPVYNLHLRGGRIATKQDHDMEANRIISEVWNAAVVAQLGSEEAADVVEEFLGYVELVEAARDQLAGATFPDLDALQDFPDPIPVGQRLFVRAKGYSYEVLDANATDADLVTGGGVKLQVLEGANGFLSAHAFGAVGDDTVDDTTTLQRALNAAEARGAAGVFIPPGVFRITEPLRIPGSISLIGADPVRSVIRPDGCDGLHILPSDAIAPRIIGNFWLHGGGADNNAAVYSDMDSGTGGRATGIVFDRLYISFFGKGIRARGLWHCTFRSCVLNQVHVGFDITDRNVKTLIDDCRITRGGSVPGTLPSIGVHVGSGAVTPEDVIIRNSIIYGFHCNIKWDRCLYGAITNCDLDATLEYCVEVTTAIGGLTISGCWLANANAAGTLTLLRFVALVANSDATNITVRDCQFRVNVANPNATAIFVGDYHQNISIQGCGFSGGFSYAILLGANTQNLRVENNTALSGQFMLTNTKNLKLHGNHIWGALTLFGLTQSDIGANYGVRATRQRGSVTIPAGATSATATWASMGLPDLPDGTYGKHVVLNNPGAASRGAIWAEATTTGITVYVTMPLGVEAAMTFEVVIY